MKPDTQFGPIQNAKQYERVQGLIEDAGREGKIIAGGKVAGPGFFVRPTIVRDAADNARIVREERFGPILPLLRYKDIDDAINRANDTDYGLGATVWGKDTKRAAEIAMKIKSGVVWVNSDRKV